MNGQEKYSNTLIPKLASLHSDQDMSALISCLFLRSYIFTFTYLGRCIQPVITLVLDIFASKRVDPVCFFNRTGRPILYK